LEFSGKKNIQTRAEFWSSVIQWANENRSKYTKLPYIIDDSTNPILSATISETTPTTTTAITTTTTTTATTTTATSSQVAPEAAAIQSVDSEEGWEEVSTLPVQRRISYSINPRGNHNLSNPMFNTERPCPLLQPNKEAERDSSTRLQFPYMDSIANVSDASSPRGEVRVPQLTPAAAFTVNTQTPYRSSAPPSPAKPN